MPVHCDTTECRRHALEVNCSRGHGVLVGQAAAVSCVVVGWAEVTEAGLISGPVVEHLDVLEQHRGTPEAEDHHPPSTTLGSTS